MSERVTDYCKFDLNKYNNKKIYVKKCLIIFIARNLSWESRENILLKITVSFFVKWKISSLLFSNEIEEGFSNKPLFHITESLTFHLLN